MDSLRPQQVAYEAQRAQANRQELAERIARAIRDDGRVEPLNVLYLNRVSSPTEPVHGVSDPPMRDVERLRQAASISRLHEAARGQ